MTRLNHDRFPETEVPKCSLIRVSTIRMVPWTGIALCAVALAGCQTVTGNPLSRSLLGRGDEIAGDESRGVASDESEPGTPPTLAQKTKKSTAQLMNFVTGREQEDALRAKTLYRQGDGLFRQASSLPNEEAAKTFKASAKLFRKAAEAAPGSALEQDALYMQGESLFFADRLTEATEVYQSLQKQYPRSRHNDRVAARLFAISRYWIDTVKASENDWISFNLTDPKRPRLDVDGHAIRVLDQIRYDDPTGRLADDATMAAAAEFIRQKKFDQADEFLTDLRETFSDSDHQFLAHLLGIRCKLEVYAGAKYSGLVLEEAEKLVRQTRQRFPDRLDEPKYADIVARASAEIAYLRAERLAYRAEYREKRQEYGAAKYYYKELLASHSDTPQAELARERLAAIDELPDVPARRLAFLTTIFPDSNRSEPLKTTEPGGEDQPASETILR